MMSVETPKIWVCLQSWAPLRAEASSRSEMVSSLLFGERCELLNQEGEWLHVRCMHDLYVGWIPNLYLQPLTAEWQKMQWSVVHDHVSVLLAEYDYIDLSPGSWVPNLDVVHLNGKEYRYTRRWSMAEMPLKKYGVSPRLSPLQSRVIQSAVLLLNAPYLWGGRSQWGIDCSGLVQIVGAMVGVKMPRDAYQQAQVGQRKMYHQLAAGDLAYFSNADGKVVHVGIVIENHQIIHAYGRVRIDHLSPNGIVNTETQEITHKLCDIRSWY